jgi:chromosome segregation ATPase
MAARTGYLGDEVHQMQAELEVLRHDCEVTKLDLARKTEECRGLAAQLSELKADYDIQFTDAVAIRAVLEQLGSALSSGLQRYADRRSTRQEIHNQDQQQQQQQRPAVIEQQPEKPPVVPKNEGSIYAPKSADKIPAVDMAQLEAVLGDKL